MPTTPDRLMTMSSVLPQDTTTSQPPPLPPPVSAELDATSPTLRHPSERTVETLPPPQDDPVLRAFCDHLAPTEADWLHKKVLALVESATTYESLACTQSEVALCAHDGALTSPGQTPQELLTGFLDDQLGGLLGLVDAPLSSRTAPSMPHELGTLATMDVTLVPGSLSALTRRLDDLATILQREPDVWALVALSDGDPTLAQLAQRIIHHVSPTATTVLSFGHAEPDMVTHAIRDALCQQHAEPLLRVLQPWSITQEQGPMPQQPEAQTFPLLRMCAEHSPRRACDPRQTLRIELETSSRYDAARRLLPCAILLSLKGLPVFDVPALFGHSSLSTDLHVRSSWNLETLESNLRNPWSDEATHFGPLAELIRSRATHPAFHPLSEQELLESSPGILMIRRTAANRSSLLVVANLTNEPQRVPLSHAATSAIDGIHHSVERHLEPFAFDWLIEQSIELS